MPTIAIANQKGGVGKTTLSIHLASWLTSQGQKVIVVDADSQANATSWLLGAKLPVTGWAAMFLTHRPAVESLHPVNGYGGLLPGNDETGDTLTFLQMLGRPFTTVADKLRPLATIADYVLIDMPPSKASGFRELLFAANYVLVPTTLERLSLEGVGLIARTCTQIKADQGSGPRLLGIVPNMTRHTNEHQEQMKALVHAFQGTVWPPIPLATCVTEACSFGTTVFARSPRHIAAKRLGIIGGRVLDNAPAGGRP